MTSVTIDAGVAAALYSSSGTYLTARAGSGVGASGSLRFGQLYYGGVYYDYEGFFDFDTSAIPLGATINSAALSYVHSAYNYAFTLEARAHDFGASLEAADWVAGADLAGKALVGTLAITDSLAFGTRYSLTCPDLPASIVKGGHTRIVFSSALMRAGAAPLGYEYAEFRNAVGERPQLTVDYTAAASTSYIPGVMRHHIIGAKGVRVHG
jgi:hypothetical protein